MRDEVHRQIGLADSQHRGGVLLAALEAEPDDDKAREMLASWFNACDALKPWAKGLRDQFARVGFVTDDPDVPPPTMPVKVYRGAWDDDDPETALSWTTRREVAEAFCRGLVGMRAKIVFGIDRPDNTPTIYQGLCVYALGWITGRGEAEIVAGRHSVQMVQPIAQLLREGETPRGACLLPGLHAGDAIGARRET